MQLIHAIPALPVRQSAASVAFYRDKLGFDVRHEDAGFAIMARDGVEVHLWQADDEAWRGRVGECPIVSGAESFIAGTASCRVEVSGVDQLYAEFLPRGVLHPNGPLANKPWGVREFAILDPDNNCITFFERR